MSWQTLFHLIAKKIEHINSTNSCLSGHIKKLEELIHDLQSHMETCASNNTNSNKNGYGNYDGNINGNHNRNGNANVNCNRNSNGNGNGNGNVNGNVNFNINRNGNGTRDGRGGTKTSRDTLNNTKTEKLCIHGKTGNDPHTSDVCLFPDIGHKSTNILDDPKFGSTFGM